MSNLSPDQKRKLDSIVNEGVATNEKIKMQREGLNDAIKAVAEELDIKPKVIRKVISVASKMNFDEIQEDHEAVADLLQQTGRAV